MLTHLIATKSTPSLEKILTPKNVNTCWPFNTCFLYKNNQAGGGDELCHPQKSLKASWTTDSGHMVEKQTLISLQVVSDALIRFFFLAPPFLSTVPLLTEQAPLVTSTYIPGCDKCSAVHWARFSLCPVAHHPPLPARILNLGKLHMKKRELRQWGNVKKIKIKMGHSTLTAHLEHTLLQRTH